MSLRRTLPTALVVAALPAAGAGTGTPPTFAPYQSYDVGSWPESVAIADLTGDGRSDVAMSTSYYFDEVNDFKVFLFVQQPDGTLAAPLRLATGGQYGDDMGLAAGDLDGDGRADLAVASAVGVNVFVQRDWGLEPATTVDAPVGRDVEIGDVDGDGVNDLVANGRYGVQVFRGPAVAAVAPVTVTPSGQTEIELGDVTGDGRTDIVGLSGSTVSAFPQLATGGFGPAWTQTGTVSGAGIAIADLNGDGLQDVAMTGGGNRPSSVVNRFLQTPSGVLGQPLTVASYDIPQATEAADMNGDGADDLVVLHGGWNRAGVYAQGPTGIGSESLYPIPYASSYPPKGLALGDVNSDGHDDIVLADYNSGLVVLRGAGQPPDVTPPDTFITDGPSGTVTSDTATFSFTASEPNASFACSLDGATFSACASPVTYTRLAPGSHTFAVRATDTAGNTDATPATRTWSVVVPADLRLALTATPEPVKSKGTLTYVQAVANDGPGTALQVTTTQSLPSGTSLLGVTPSQGSCAAVTGPAITCSLGSIAPGGQASVQITAKVTAPGGSTLTSTASVDSSSYDPDPADDTASATTTVKTSRR